MENNIVKAALNNIEAATVATDAMKKEEEKKMIKEETVSAERKALIAAARKAAKELDTVRAAKDKKTWAQGMDASEALNNALAALNEDVLTEVYTDALRTDAPITAICKAMAYPRWYAKTNKKDNVTVLESRSTRLSVLDFIKFAEESDTFDSIKDGDKIKTALCDAARKVSDYVLDTLKSEKTISIQTPKKALNALFSLLKIEGVIARSVDMRFIVYATTKAKKLGELAAITDKSIVPYIMDVISVQLRGVEYKFEEKEEEAKA